MVKFHEVLRPNGEIIKMPVLGNGLYPCPVCGYIPILDENDCIDDYIEPWYNPFDGVGSCDICPSCHYQPICDDASIDGTVTGTWAVFRKDWLMRWVNVDKVWIDELGGYTVAIDAIRQLRNIGINIDEDCASSKEALLEAIKKM